MAWHGSFCWYELMTSDPDAAQAFYGDVVGWGCESAGMAGFDYRLFTADGTRIAGLMPRVEGGPPPSWTGYVAVDDCDASAARARELGGTVHRAPSDIPGVGRFAILADPEGAMLAILTPLSPEGAPAPSLEGAGRCGWHELHARDLDAVWPFYEGLFGWELGERMPLPNGVYQLFRTGGGERDIGGFANDADAPRPFWNFYFNVDGVAAGMERTARGGGTVHHGPYQVPGGAWIAMCTDPQHAFFSLTAATR